MTASVEDKTETRYQAFYFIYLFIFLGNEDATAGAAFIVHDDIKDLIGLNEMMEYTEMTNIPPRVQGHL